MASSGISNPSYATHTWSASIASFKCGFLVTFYRRSHGNCALPDQLITGHGVYPDALQVQKRAYPTTHYP